MKKVRGLPAATADFKPKFPAGTADCRRVISQKSLHLINLRDVQALQTLQKQGNYERKSPKLLFLCLWGNLAGGYWDPFGPADRQLE
jgi:hypothetical protein